MNKFNPKKTFSAIIVGLIIGSSLAGLTAFAKIYAHGRIKAGTSVAGIDLSYLTQAEALQNLLTASDNYLQSEITITINQTTKSFTPSQLGIEILPQDTLYILDKVDATKLDFLDIINPMDDGISASFLVTIEASTLKQTLDSSFGLDQISPQSASFYFEGKKLQIKPEQPGESIDYQDLITQLKSQSKDLHNQPIKINTTPVEPQITQQDLEEQKDLILEKLNHKITLIDPVYSDNWDIYLIDHLDWVTFQNNPEITITDIFTPQPTSKKFSININQSALNTYVDQELSKWLDKESNPTKITINEEDQIEITGNGTDGLEIQRDKLASMIELAAENLITEVEIPVYKITAELEIDPKLQAMGITERIAQGHTSYYGSPANRVHNIKLGAAQFEGLLLQPGEEFSFNTNLGAVDGSTGYRKELVIKPEGTIPEYGGGICQVSTTMYRAALLGGLDITDRREHSYAVSYYSQIMGHGLDATIYIGGQDLKFKNDTEYPILMHTYVDNDYELYINFYGTSDGRKTELEGPFISNYYNPGPTQYVKTNELPSGQTKQVQNAHTGFYVDWNYRIIRPNGEVEEQVIETRYKAVPAKVLIGEDSA